MPNLLAMSFEGALTPAFDLHCLDPGRRLPDGWGVACYPGGEPAALVMKEAAPAEGSLRSALVSAWEQLESSIFLVHIRTATWGAITEANTQPLQRAWGRRDWLIAHSGSLDQQLELTGRFEPIGSTDSERILCELLARAAGLGARSLGEVPATQLHAWLGEMNQLGALTCALSDGLDLVVYADARGRGEAHVQELLPPHGQIAFGDADLTIDLTRRGVHSRKGVIVSSNPLASRTEHPADWRRLAPGHLLVIRQGAVRDEQGLATQTISVPALPEPPPPGSSAPVPGTSAVSDATPSGAGTGDVDTGGAPADEAAAGVSTESAPKTFVPRRRPRHDTGRAPIRRLAVVHRTTYRYEKPVERSTHLLRLVPAHDRLQTLVACDVSVSVRGQVREFEDVFGNRARRLVLEAPYTELAIEARSQVELRDVEPLDFRPLRVRSTIPLGWMPWQRQILQPFLLPPELPESELHELNDYAMSFAERNDFDLLDTLLDLNATIFSEFEYRQNSTTLSTSPFDVYANRRGVCQDFANLFICLARLLGVPARYVCGYLWTGPKAHNQRMAEASHAWVQVYLPEVGWKGFDPTNGVLTQTSHVRVAVGRNFVDAAPTSGTIFIGGGRETLEVVVNTVDLEQAT